ncbi:hypothetical protein JQF37_27230 [Pseudomonas sp. MIL9]|uniref:hypothetical protein n=1 Tax=Pseudomonas sp. MIL9 TaxID=2807620 RepID=UPI0010292AF5|nr:hypothetical protein [Pseudomonas sp. MIL9]MBM6447288.1 hypothetical protein [Pseudomonas sp. MIL9]RZO03732.1 hypothetical protein EKG40_24800 [Pseudomonas moorei]
MASSFKRLTAEQVRANYRKQFFVADLEVPKIVDAMPGDPDGLIHKDKLGAALKVEIPVWDDRPPFSGVFNVLTLECLLSSSPEWVRIGAPKDIPWPGDLPDDEFPLEEEIPLHIFRDYEGEISFRYLVKNWHDNSVRASPAAPLTIDRTGPLWADPEHAVIDIVEKTVITDAVLARDNGVFCVIPDFIEAKRTDVQVIVAWLDRVPLPTEDITQFVVLFTPLPPDRKVLVPADFVRRYGSKTQYAVAFLQDKAGNRGEMSLPATVNVALGTLPSGLQRCTVPLAADGVIDRADAAFPTKVHIPMYTGWNPDDGVVVSWGNTELARTSVGAHLPFDLMISVPWAHMAGEYDFNSATHVQPVKVDYKILRGDYTDPTGHSMFKLLLAALMVGGDEMLETGASSISRSAAGTATSASPIPKKMVDLGAKSRFTLPSAQASVAAPRSAPKINPPTPVEHGALASTSSTSASRASKPATASAGKRPELVKGAFEQNRINFPEMYKRVQAENAPGAVVSTKLVGGMETFNLKAVAGEDSYFGLQKRITGLRKPEKRARDGRFQWEQN